jgi:hypothetical protein
MPTRVLNLEQEMYNNYRRFLSLHPELRDLQEEINPHARFPASTQLSYYYFEKERMCLEALYKAVKRSKRRVGALIHDGLLVLRTGPGQLPDKLLRQWEEAIFRDTGYSVSLAEKTMERSPIFTRPKKEEEQIRSSELEQARKLLGMLNRQRADKKQTWKDLGRVLHSISPDLLEDWKRFSKKSVNHKEGDCEAEWLTFEPSPKSEIAQLQRWARQDSPDIFRPQVPQEVLELCNKGDRGLAELAHLALKDVIRLTTNRGHREYFYFDNKECIWRKVSDGI